MVSQPGCYCSICREDHETKLKDEALTLKLDGPNSTLHDSITFAIRDNHSPRLWADADDIAETVIKAIAVYRKSVTEDEFLDSVLAGDTNNDMSRLRTYITSLLDEVYFPNANTTDDPTQLSFPSTNTPTQLSIDAANILITELNLRAEWGSLDENNDGILADTREELTPHKQETIKLRYVTEWEPQHD